MAVPLHASASVWATAEPAADQSADFVDRLACEAVAVDFQTLQILGEPHLEAEDFERQVGLLEQPLPALVVLRSDQGLEQRVEVPLDPLAQHKAVVAGKAARVVAGPENQVIGLGDNRQFLLFSH